MDFELSKEQKDIQKAAGEFAIGEIKDIALEYDQKEEFPMELWKKASELGFIGLYIKEEFGGGDLGVLEQSLVMEEFWKVDPGCGCILLTAFGSNAIQNFGTKEQKNKYIPPLSSGGAIMGTAITEPDAGSDVFGISTTARKDGDDYVINGSKMFVTSGTIADYLAVFCVTDDRSSRTNQHSLILIETDRPGFEATKISGKMGIRASDTAEVALNDVRVPKENLVGEEGQGFELIMHLFNFARIEASAQGVGVAQGALDKAVAHMKKRQAFGRPIGTFQALQFKVADMATMIECGRNLYYKAATRYDSGVVDRKLIAMSKWYCGEVGVRVTDEALQIHGGYGYIAEYDIERFYRAAKIVEIYEATKEIEKQTVATAVLGKL
ncbi:acyl-CoA dehydrogenase family protein [Thermodesulfobacteriota bacterium]